MKLNEKLSKAKNLSIGWKLPLQTLLAFARRTCLAIRKRLEFILNMKRILITLPTIVLVLLGIYWLFGSSQTTAELSFPYYGTNVSTRDSFACRAIVDGVLHGDVNKKKIFGEVSRGTDDVALVIKDNDTLVMSTAASVRVGMAEGDQMHILENDKDKLTAVWYGAGNGVISTIVLNKKNGLAIWNKGNPDFALLGLPMGEVVYLTCL